MELSVFRSMNKLRSILLLLFLIPHVANALPGDILFSDNFERAAIAPWTTTSGVRSNIGAQTSNSGTRSLYTRHNIVTTTSPITNLAGKYAKLEMWIRRGSDVFSEDPDNGEDLIIEYYTNLGSWVQIASYPGGVTPGEVFNLNEQLPSAALHANFRLRVRQTGGSNADYDYWHIDDVVITETGFVAPPPPLAIGECDTFEGNLNNWIISQTGGFVTIGNNTSQSPTHDLEINGGSANATSIPIDTTSNFKEVTMWIRRGSDTFSEDPDPGEDFFVEYLNASNSWVLLETFLGSGIDGQIYNRTYPMPANAKHANFRLRLRMQSGNGAGWDYWHIDDVCLNPIANYPNINIQKTSSVLNDGINAVNPKRIPGALVEYNIIVSNSGAGATDNNSVIISDAIPTSTSLYVNDISGAGTGPIRFVDGSPPSGLAYNFTSLASTTDDVSFSNNNGANYSYTPTPDANGVDTAVTNIRVSPQGVFLAPSGSGNPSFTIKFRVKVN